MAIFTGSSWIAAGERVQQAADDFYTGAHDVTVAAAVHAGASAHLDPAVAEGDGRFNAPWHQLIANGVEAMYMDGSKMVSTGRNYDAMEERGTTAAERFWGAD